MCRSHHLLIKKLTLWVNFSSLSIQFKFEGNIRVFLQGATIKTDEETGKIVIARVMHGGAADRSGLIHVGDEVVEVNNINVEGKTPNDVLKILVTFKSLQFLKSLKFKIITSVWLSEIIIYIAHHTHTLFKH